MSVGATPAEPCAAATVAAAAARPRVARLAHLALAAGTAALLAVVVTVSAVMAAARVPQHRAALEDLIRAQTGLEVRFRELTVGWGWYGPEAVFHAVSFRARAGRMLLRAPRLSVALDAWRTLRSGRLAAGRIDIDGGAVQLPPAGGAALSVPIRHAWLRREGSSLRAEALVRLPAALGAGAHVTLDLHGDPAQWQLASGAFSVEGRRLEFAGWRSLIAGPPLARYLPRAGRGNLTLRARFAHGTLLAAQGAVGAQGLEWDTPGAPLALARLQGSWSLARSGPEWRFSAPALRLGDGPQPLVSISAVAHTGGAYLRGQVHHVPLATLAALAGGYAPQSPLGRLALTGTAGVIDFDWRAQRPEGARLVSTATLEDVTLATPAHEVTLSGLGVHVAALEAQLDALVSARAARLRIAGPQPLELAGIELHANLRLERAGAGWRLATDDLEARRAKLRLDARGELAAGSSAATPRVRAQLALRDADASLVAGLLAPVVPAVFGADAARVSAGRIESAELTVSGPLSGSTDWDAPGNELRGVLNLRAARVEAGRAWPEARELDARMDWHGTRAAAVIEHARSGSFELTAGRAQWDLRGAHPTRLAAQLSGSAQEALGWLRERPELAAAAPALQALDLRGHTTLEVDVTLPAARPQGAAARASGTLQVAAALEGASLRPFPGVPDIEALRGTLAFAGGHLQRSTLSGRWLGGPVTLRIGARGADGTNTVAISATGLLAVSAALQAAGAGAQGVPLAGNASWSALLTLDGAGPAARWLLHADSSLAGVASRLPQPFVKETGAKLPLHVELEGAGGSALLHVALADRLRALAALTRQGDGWRIERGAVRLAASPPELPADPVLALDGGVGRLDLPAWLALWRDAAQDAALPALRQLRIDDLRWQGRSLGRLQASFRTAGGLLQSAVLRLAGLGGEWHALASCTPAVCRARVELESGDAASTLAALGLASDFDARRARLAGRLQWAAGAVAPLASLQGDLHMQLQDGVVRPRVAGAVGVPFALLSVPALIGGLGVEARPGEDAGLRFKTVTADFELRHGEATTDDLHFDGDAEILVRGRVGLIEHDYDEQAFILRGEERLPSAVRRLGPTPRIAAWWLALRELVAGAGLPRAPAELRLWGTWRDPRVTPAE